MPMILKTLLIYFIELGIWRLLKGGVEKAIEAKVIPWMASVGSIPSSMPCTLLVLY